LTAPVNLVECQQAARAILPRKVYDYYARGSWDEITLRRNHPAFDDISLSYRVLRDVSRRDLTTRVLGRRISLPVIVAPTA
jgi:4-hydroxymandelate oxidase